MEAVAPEPCASQSRQQVTARRVVDHVADEERVGSTVGEAPLPLDEIDQLKMMREVASATDGKQFRPGEPEERGEDGQHNPGESHQVGRGP